MIQRLINQIKKSDPGTADSSHIDLPRVGEIARDFSLPAASRPFDQSSQKIIALSDLRGNPAVLVFYPADNSSVCSSQLTLYNEALLLIQEHDARLVAISTDDPSSHRDFAERMKLDFPLLSDSDPAGAVANEFGVLNPNDGLCERALFVLDGEGRVHWRAVYPRNTNPGMDGILEALESLSIEKDS
ncbi:MAG TPA: redoxin domain-containing protein [candidate division Zixibacteria bacterium]|nr:redoxin domain-containing protein [candidate division Zixibacteria bacterium]